MIDEDEVEMLNQEQDDNRLEMELERKLFGQTVWFEEDSCVKN